MLCRPHNEGKIALQAEIIRKTLTWVTYVVKYDYISSF
jgi:hypothetical protein